MRDSVSENDEVYNFLALSINISRALADVKAGKVHPQREHLDMTFVDAYAEQVLALKRELGAYQKGIGIFSSVNARRALDLPQNVLDEPLLMMYVGRNKGVIKLRNTDQNYVMADGNHRMARAYFDYRVKPMEVLIFSYSQTRKYMI